MDARRPEHQCSHSETTGTDLGCYGGEIDTPNLDRLAAGGLRFTQFYNTARCCPTRASLLTGLYPHQAGVGHMMDDKGGPGYRGDLNAAASPSPRCCSAAGYRTYLSGKWHVTRHIAKPDGPKDNWPLQRGFDRFYGTINGGRQLLRPRTLGRDNVDDPRRRPRVQAATYYYTDAISDHAVAFIAEHARPPRTSRSSCTSPTPRRTGRCTRPTRTSRSTRASTTPARSRSARRGSRRRAKLGLIDPKWSCRARGDWDAVGTTSTRSGSARMEVYAAMIDRMDQGIGRIVAELKKTGQLDNTLVLFLAGQRRLRRGHGGRRRK